MSRPPRARLRILEAARRILRKSGAQSLTLARIAQESGVSRGGILYHWPSRKVLLRALVEYDCDAWEHRCRALASGADADVAGHIRCALDPTHGDGEAAASLLSEVRDDPVARQRVEQFALQRFRDWPWDPDDIARYVLLLAAEGAFWRRVHGVVPLADGVEARMLARIEACLGTLHRRPSATSQGR